MPYRRTKSKSKKTRMYKTILQNKRTRRWATKRRALGISLNVHNFKRRTTLFGSYGAAINTTLITTTGLHGGYASTAFNFYLSHLSNYSEFANLFDVYKITKVVLYVTCLTTNINMADSHLYGIGLPKLYYVHDEDDVSAPSASITGLAEMQERVKCKFFSFTPTKNVCKIVVKPNLLAENYKTALATCYTPTYGRWVDMADVQAPYYGMKLLFHVPSVADTVPDDAKHYFTVDAVYYFSCKDVR